MQIRPLAGLDVSVLGLGTGRLASLGTRRSVSEVAALLAAAADTGINFIDTADTYGSGACERMLGEALERFPARTFHVATKGGLAMVDLPGPLRIVNQPAKKLLVASGRRHGVGPESIRRRIEASRRRLRRDTLDVWFLHAPPLEALRDEQLLDVLRSASTSGVVRHLGVSSDDGTVLAAAVDSGIFEVVQTRSGPWPDSLHHIPVVANQVLTAATPALRTVARRVASETGLTETGVLLRSAAARSGTTTVVVGTADPSHLSEDAAAFATPVADVDRLDEARPSS